MGIGLEAIPTQVTEDSKLNFKHQQVISWKISFPYFIIGSVDSDDATSEEKQHETSFPLGCQMQRRPAHQWDFCPITDVGNKLTWCPPTSETPIVNPNPSLAHP